MKKVAVPVTGNKKIDDHFGHCEFYAVYTLNEKNEIVNEEVLASPQGCGCKSNIASVLAANGVTTMLAGGIGGGAINVLAMNGIDVVRGCSGDARLAVEKFANGQLMDSGESCAQHEHHHGGEGHTCSH